MTRHTLFLTSVLALFLAAGSALADGGEAGSVHGSFDKAECRYARWDGRHGWSTEEVRRTIRCSVGRWSVPGGVSKAVAVARCESGLNERAVSPSGYLGVYQFARSTWDSTRGRYRDLGRRWGLSWRPLNGRANVVTAIRMAHEGGWGPWSGGVCA